jgi:N6-adenosine-specific RNA methylase IME4
MLDFNKIFDPCARSVQIEAIHIGNRYRQVRDIQSLQASIAELGLLQPVVVHPGGFLIAGARRVAACQALGWDEIPARVIALEQAIRGERDENVVREPFTPSEMVAIGEATEEMERAAAKQRQLSTLRQGDQAPVVENFHHGDAGKTRDKVASYFGKSGKTYEKAKAIVKAANAEPEKYGKLQADMDRSGRVENAFRRLKAAQQGEEIRQESPPLPQRGPYRVIVADPPWAYQLRQQDPSKRTIMPYPPMSTADICAVDIASIAHDDCVLWLWVTNSHMRDAFDVLDAWGFEQKTILTWAKNRMVTGDWLRGQTEHCIMAVRGKPTVVLTNQTTLLHGPVREHSQKPDEFYALVETLCPAPRYAYLFSREERAGWDMHGDELPKAAA